MESRLTSTTIFLEYLVHAEIRNERYKIEFKKIYNHSGKMTFTDKENSKNYEANFAVSGEPLSARVYITIVLFGAKFYKLENGVLKGSHLITSRAQSLYKKLRPLQVLNKDPRLKSI